jgi:butyrate kinase
LPFRIKTVLETLEKKGIQLQDIELFVGRGGGLLPMLGGTYQVDETLLDHARKGMPGQHPAQLGSQISADLASRVNGQAFIVNSPDTDEFDDIARICGIKEIFRRSSLHALNQKEIVLRYCQAKKLEYEKVNLIVCHIGGGISITSHHHGRMIDSNNILGGDGPMTPTRAGTIPALQFLKLCFSGKYTEKELATLLTKEGGLMDHLGTSDTKEVEAKIAAGDKYADLVYRAMIYQIAKDVGSQTCVLKGHVDGIILTGGISNSQLLVDKLSEYISWIAPIEVMAGEFEMEALAAGALRVANGLEKVKKYSGKPVWTDFNHLKS